MSDQQPLWSEVDTYIDTTLHLSDSILENTLAANAAAGLPLIDVAPNQGKLLHLFARMQKAKRILEIGTLGGYSTICLARALPADGHLITLEFSQKHATVAQQNIANAGLAHLVEIRQGPAADSLRQLQKDHVAPFDMIFIDADKPNNPVYLEWAITLSHPGTLILCDNVIREGEIADPASTDPSVTGTRSMFDMLAANPRLSATAIQTVGSKGYDGFAMALVLE
jgi:predicted O-methyltransferase YrrM